MPIYDFRCARCSLQFERQAAMAAPAPPCPRCGGASARVMVAAPAIHGAMARGRDMAARSLPQCGKGCRCCP